MLICSGNLALVSLSFTASCLSWEVQNTSKLGQVRKFAHGLPPHKMALDTNIRHEDGKATKPTPKLAKPNANIAPSTTQFTGSRDCRWLLAGTIALSFSISPPDSDTIRHDGKYLVAKNIVTLDGWRLGLRGRLQWDSSIFVGKFTWISLRYC